MFALEFCSHLQHFFAFIMIWAFFQERLKYFQLTSYFFLKFLLEDNCFTILCWFLPHINMNQPQVYICRLPLEPPSHLPPHPTPLCCHTALGWAPWGTQQVSLAICVTYGHAYVSMPLFQFVPPSPSHSVHKSVLYVCVSTAAHQYHLSRIHTCLNIWHLSFSFWLTSLCTIGSRLPGTLINFWSPYLEGQRLPKDFLSPLFLLW